MDFDAVSFAYPGGGTVLHDVNLHIGPRSRIAIVGETGSGKSTLAKFLTRLMDPTEGEVRVDGVDLRRVRFASLRDRVVLVPQEGFLFDASLLENIRFGRPGASDADVRLAVTELGLDTWLEGLPRGLQTDVGQRGESLSAGSGSWSPSPGPTSPIPTSSCSTRPPLRSTCRPRCACSARSKDSPAGAPRSPSRTASPQRRRPTRWWWSMPGASWSVDLTETVSAGGVYAALHASWAAQQSHRAPWPRDAGWLCIAQEARFGETRGPAGPGRARLMHAARRRGLPRLLGGVTGPRGRTAE